VLNGLFAAALLALFCVRDASAEDKQRAKRKINNPFSVFAAIGKDPMFSKGYSNDFFPGTVEEIQNEEAQGAKEKTGAKAADHNASSRQAAAADSRAALEHGATTAEASAPPAAEAAPQQPTVKFTEDFKPGDLRPPDENVPVRVNKDAPAPFIGLVDAWQRGDRETAEAYADSFVRYQQNYFFEVRELTQLIGQALIRQKQIKEDDWPGVPQLIDYEMARMRKENGEIFRPTNDAAMARIKPDPQHQADVYFFFNLNCSWCRYMAPDVERLYRAVRNDPRVRIVGLTTGPAMKDWLAEYRNYTGLSMPVFEGEKVAKSFGVRFTPALVVVSPNRTHAYLKTGQQSFARMYQFVRRVQGLPVTEDPQIRAIADAKIGEIENSKFQPGKNLSEWLTKDDLHLVDSHLPGGNKKIKQKIAAGQSTRPRPKMEKF
jgi:hypothetical protein